MINAKRLVVLARKWQKVVSIGRTTLSLKASAKADLRVPSKPLADKGHFIVYTMDRKRFMVPLVYLNSPIFRALFKMSEDEFGLQCNGPITLPCEAVDMDCILLLIQRHVTKIPRRIQWCIAPSLSTTDKTTQQMLLHSSHTG